MCRLQVSQSAKIVDKVVYVYGNLLVIMNWSKVKKVVDV